MHYQDLQKEYSTLIYKDFKIADEEDFIKVTYTYILGNYTFTPSVTINKTNIKNNNVNQEFLSYLFFNYGLVDIINYFKLSCPKKVIIEAGYINQDQINFFKKLIYNGLSEYFYRNNIDLSYIEFTNFEVNSDRKFNFSINDNFDGNLILVGGGKDSIVSLELLKDEKLNNSCFLFERNIYPKNIPSYKSIETAGYTEDDIKIFNAEIDPLLLELNKKGFLNGHVPFSSQLAFASYIMAYLNNKKYIITSNEASSNEGNIEDSNVNHQYSKSIDFENDFRSYVNKYFMKDIEYFSLLRPLLEIQIAKIFSHYPKYFHTFRSCNLSTKNTGTNWCCNCPKCLFIFIILSPYIDLKTLTNIFSKNLLNEQDFLETFKELLGEKAYKPFECVGTFEEVKYACSKTVRMLKERKEPLPYLLEYFDARYHSSDDKLEYFWNDINNVPSKWVNKIRKELNEHD